jgi:hypothetical protein
LFGISSGTPWPCRVLAMRIAERIETLFITPAHPALTPHSAYSKF